MGCGWNESVIHRSSSMKRPFGRELLASSALRRGLGRRLITAAQSTTRCCASSRTAWRDELRRVPLGRPVRSSMLERRELVHVQTFVAWPPNSARLRDQGQSDRNLGIRRRHDCWSSRFDECGTAEERSFAKERHRSIWVPARHHCRRLCSSSSLCFKDSNFCPASPSLPAAVSC
jgi:hypothetical protein